MLRKIRIILAALCFAGITLLFLGIGRDWWGFLPKLQLLPAAMRVIGGATLGNAAVLSGILLLTLLAGRIYCSVLCPLGVFQDLVIWIRRRLGKHIRPLRKKFGYSAELAWLRYAVAALFIICIVFDMQIVVALLGPYSAYGRMVMSLLGGSPAPVVIAAVLTFAVTAVCAFLWGRAYCNAVCPVGTVLGSISRYQIFAPVIDSAKCIKCGSCARECKASCIDDKNERIDYSRCVDCFDCIDNCRTGAISFGRVRKHSDAVAESVPESADKGRRAFLNSSAVLIAGAAGTAVAHAQEMKLDGGLAEVKPKSAIERNPRLVPPGASGEKHFYSRCTACQLCVAACPNGVLRPSTDAGHLMQPQMGYEKGFCRPECTACSEVCPTGAIVPVTREAKTLIHIGTAAVDPSLCFAATGEEKCGSCARHCPTGAISMVETDGTMRPVVAEAQCIGCGKCEYLCPARPISAITVKGLSKHI